MEQFLNFLHYPFWFIVIISIVVFIHEYGHYAVAKLCGVKVEAFSIGFGPEIRGIVDKSGTRWKISAIPLGGYVKMFGDEGAASTPDHEALNNMTPEEEKQAFHSKSLWAKSAIVAAGPAANFLLAIVLLTFFFTAYGRPYTAPEVKEVTSESAAEIAGILPGDVIKEIDGTTIHRFDDIRRIVSINPNASLALLIMRGEELITLNVTPKLVETTDAFGNTVTLGQLGIQSGEIDYTGEPLPIGKALLEATIETYNITALNLKAIGNIITGKLSADNLGGPIKIAKYSGQSAELGFKAVLYFMVLLSIGLGMINLFPIPMLDGGHLLYYAIEAVRGKPMAEKFQEWGFRVGFILIASLMVFVIFNDIKSLDLF